jgi:hypothetical protein
LNTIQHENYMPSYSMMMDDLEFSHNLKQLNEKRNHIWWHHTFKNTNFKSLIHLFLIIGTKLHEKFTLKLIIQGLLQYYNTK